MFQNTLQVLLSAKLGQTVISARLPLMEMSLMKLALMKPARATSVQAEEVLRDTCLFLRSSTSPIKLLEEVTVASWRKTLLMQRVNLDSVLPWSLKLKKNKIKLN